MAIFSKIFGKKKTVDTTNPNHAQPQQHAVQQGHNEQANAFDDFEIVNNVIPDGTPVADVYLNVDTESASRSHMTLKELKNADVGHTWLTIKPLNGQLPADLDNMVQPATHNLIEAHGETAIGFWPITVREKSTHGKKLSEKEAAENAEENAKNKAEAEIHLAKGYTAGSGAISRDEMQNYELHSASLGKDTAGRVEEPDDAHSPKGRKVYRITRKQFRAMYRYIEAHRNHKYNLYSYNCTTFAAHALQAAGQTVPMEGMTMPTSLYEAMYKEAKAHAKAVEKAKKRNLKIEKSSVELLKLAEGEAHRKKGKSKEGPNGKDVRVKGVDKFDIPMYTDPAEVILKKVSNAGEASQDDKDLFIQHFFKDCHLRSLDAAKALTDEGIRLHIISIGDQKDIVDFYLHDYHLIQNLKAITKDPALFSDYLTKILNTLPGVKVAESFFDGKQISPEHDLNKLSQRVLWNALLCNKTGDEFANYIEPLNQTVYLEAMTDPMINAFKLALEHYTKHIKPENLNRVQNITSVVFNNDPRVHDAVYAYYKTYFNYRVSNYLMTEQDYADAQAFGNATQIQKVLDSYIKISRSVEKSKKRNFYGTVTGKNGQQVNTLPKKYIKAKTKANAPKPDENEIVAEAYLNVDTADPKGKESVSRSALTIHDVGHTWLTVKAMPHGDQQQGRLPEDVEADIQSSDTGRNTVNIIRAKGETAMGFWPLINRFVDTDKEGYEQNTDEDQKANDAETNIIQQARQDIRQFKGYTMGAGASRRSETQYTGFSRTHSVPGRVEEPDDAHTPKARKRFTLTRKQFKKLYRYVEAHRNHKYNLYTYNSTTFASHALRDAGYTAHGSRVGVCYPARMYRELYDEAKRDARHNRQGNVQLKKLEE